MHKIRDGKMTHKKGVNEDYLPLTDDQPINEKSISL